MKLIFSFLFISPALAQSGAGEETGGGVFLLLLICGVIFFIAWRKRRRRQGEENKSQTQLIRDQPPITIRVYKGNQEQATERFQRDAAYLATLGYFPTNQSWAPTRQTSIFWFGIFGKPLGALTVTYERRKVLLKMKKKRARNALKELKRRP